MTKAVTLLDLFELKKQGEPITMLTAYDATFAKLISEQGIEVILVGDSLGMVMQGLTSTVPVTMEDMVYHISCVARGNRGAFIIGDMPYMSYASETDLLHNAARLMQAGANMVKVEGGAWLCDGIKQLSERGIPVCAHLGLTPQSVDALGGFRVQGRDKASAEKMLQEAQQLQDAGASLLVLECVPADLADEITQLLRIPTIGIGAGNRTNGQVLVMQDMLGLNSEFNPKFVKNFMAEPNVQNVAEAFKAYRDAVKSRQFPAAEHSFK